MTPEETKRTDRCASSFPCTTPLAPADQCTTSCDAVRGGRSPGTSTDALAACREAGLERGRPGGCGPFLVSRVSGWAGCGSVAGVEADAGAGAGLHAQAEVVRAGAHAGGGLD